MAKKSKSGWYSWNDWFSRPWFELTRGVDYFCSQATICAAIRVQANTRKLYVTVKDLDFKVEVLVRKQRQNAVPHQKEASSAKAK